ncbi:O-antigen ligase family protein [Bosea vaviloviae]|uniref:O-antigen ligase-related domain-containing protein n=1 Tax=Bosea vaviloviae TaxID=1526658 RepID=A0A0N0MCQ6_9HYPH|nr:O-antigen ligase family protein [Bosea vaviloviae]KPH81473.1 hypothetical protein AE618_06820 [Bosea vaviloviae]
MDDIEGQAKTATKTVQPAAMPSEDAPRKRKAGTSPARRSRRKPSGGDQPNDPPLQASEPSPAATVVAAVRPEMGEPSIASPTGKATRPRKGGGKVGGKIDGTSVRPTGRKPARDKQASPAAASGAIQQQPAPSDADAPELATLCEREASKNHAPDADAQARQARVISGAGWRLRASHAMLVAALVLAPALFGSRDGATIAFWCAWLSSGILLAPSTGLTLRVAGWLAGVVVVVCAWSFVLHEHLAANPFLASEHPLWRQTANLLETVFAGSVGVQRYQAFYAVGVPMAALLAFVLGLLSCGETRQREQLVKALGYSAAVYAAFGLVSLIANPSMLLWREKIAYIGAVTGTFVNSNTAADYFTAGAIAWLALLLRRQADQRRSSSRNGGDAWRWRLRRGDATVIAAGLCCVLALILTRSRLGVALGGAALVGTYLALDRRPGQLLRRLTVAAAVAVSLLLMVGASLFARLDLLGFSDGGRLETYRNTLRMILDHPWFGVGLGSFSAAYPAYRGDGDLWWVWEAAHSTPLELAAEMGLLLAGLMTLSWLVLLIALARRFMASQETLAVVAFPVLLVGAAHSLVDFSLQTAGFAIPALALAGAALRADPRRAKEALLATAEPDAVT